MDDVRVRLATAADRPAMERLWLMCCHDMTEFGGQLPEPDGSFQRRTLRTAFTDPGWFPYLLTLRGRPAGLALVEFLPGPATHVLNAFFVVRGVRRSGVGLRAVRQVVAAHPGRWEVAFQDGNPAAGRFWRRAAAEVAGAAGAAWGEERRPVAGRPEAPLDVCISFDTGT
ncbi:GNAT family N-acetyltransferase [Streptomyces sp. 184]|uniref:GNAT family N-acetyltransferase n=1 Tax=Streptomyces sp. 184 TaxID=1827526 RepID=UPI003891C804